MKNDLDRVDLQILAAMQSDGRLSLRDLASRVSLSSTPVHDRLKRLEREGYIKKYIAVLDAEKLGGGFVVFCHLKMARMNADVANDFNSRVQTIPQVSECYNISGANDYMLKINVADMEENKQLLYNVIGQIENVASIESMFVMDEVKHEWGIGIGND